jgi:predicted nucleotidyltransferase
MGLGAGEKAYAIASASYLLARLSEKELGCVNHLILFGSAARGDATEGSDIDLFFDVDMCPGGQKVLKAKLNRMAEKFYLSTAALEYKMKGVSNEINIFVGRLAEWRELNRSVSADGIVLYGKYTSKPSETKAYTILSWEKAGRVKGALLNKLYGYRAGGKKYPGLLSKKNGMKIGKGVIMVPADQRDAFTSVLEKYKVNYSRYEVWM